jgi:hypothetical protein
MFRDHPPVIIHHHPRITLGDYPQVITDESCQFIGSEREPFAVSGRKKAVQFRFFGPHILNVLLPEKGDFVAFELLPNAIYPLIGIGTYANLHCTIAMPQHRVDIPWPVVLTGERWRSPSCSSMFGPKLSGSFISDHSATVDRASLVSREHSGGFQFGDRLGDHRVITPEHE